ncbi:GFA family protein [Labrenzia sp. OB1]|uniref:GFA family protein n=1 Tax=Labrenzia sp. OB1 TaxID=1561204 RepID=UPI0007B1F3AD|nr:GFA family protein [Labrenzia sp. OB1]KZM47889.1 aldehyde-activating protein [Labrenzia sp. OB1]
MSERLSGGCLCGAVRFTAEPEKPEMGICHCSMCRRWTGGVFMAVGCNDVQLENEDALGVYKSSGYGERVFCKTCGTSLFWRMADGSHTSASAQAFDDPSVFKLTSEIFVDEQPANFAFANETSRMTGAEVIAYFTQQQDPQHG